MKGAVIAPASIRAGPEGATLRLEVYDAGRGVSPAERARIFERFQQVDASITRRHGGAGLGRAIAREPTALTGAVIGLASGEAGT